MKKFFSLAMAFCLCAVANAQTETYYGSEESGFALTIGADPVIDFIGDMFDGELKDTRSKIGATIAGKFFLSNSFALSADLGIRHNSANTWAYEHPDNKEEVTAREGIAEFNTFQIGLGAQYILRPGKRLQPFVGANVLYARKNSYTVNEDFAYTYIDDSNENDLVKMTQYASLNKQSNPSNTFGLVANVGVEYFLVQNISISARLDLGIYSTMHNTKGKYTTEDPNIEKKVVDAGNYNQNFKNQTEFGTGLRGGNIAFNFYF